ncbi:hypothetical protein ACHJH3_10910 [Campylobacter sp. MOP7]|uniref:hypothetical protein n=1 Tax=Campylobacter canis TaxID=3378588 RepID=UPI00387EE364
MKKLLLNDRNQEISELLPKQYSAIILNSIISRSLETGILQKECAYYLTQAQMEELMQKLGHELKIVKREIRDNRRSKPYKDKLKKKAEIAEQEGQQDFDGVFFGFDD